MQYETWEIYIPHFKWKIQSILAKYSIELNSNYLFFRFTNVESNVLLPISTVFRINSHFFHAFNLYYVGFD